MFFLFIGKKHSYLNIMPTLYAIFSLGSEVRQFGHSGLLTHFLDTGWRVVVAAKIVDDDLRNQLDPRIELRQLPGTPMPFRVAQAEIILDAAHGLRETRQGKSGWKYQAAKPKNWRQWILARAQQLLAKGLSLSSSGFQLAQSVEQKWRKGLVDNDWAQLYRETGADVVLVNVPKVMSIELGLETARSLGIPTVLFYHTWKDVVVAGRLSHQFTAIGVWNAGMKHDLVRQNASLPQDNIRVIGCGHFDCVGRDDLLLAEAEFRSKLGVRPGSQIILYPASAPWVVPEEERYIDALYNAIQEQKLVDDAQLVVRINPMDQTCQLSELLKKKYPDIVVMQPEWRWEQRQNWCFQRKEDQILYNSLLHYTSVCVGIPSTVTVECAVAGVPVVNICFDLPGPAPLPGSIKSFWDADFYDLVRATGAAKQTLSIEECISETRAALTQKSETQAARQALLNQQLGVLPPHSSQVGFELITKEVLPRIRKR